MKIVKRYLALVLSFALFLALPLAFTQEASAASKGTKIWQPVQIAETTVHYNGDQSFDGSVWSYDKKGLNTAVMYQDGYADVKAYDKNGYLTSETNLDENSKPNTQTVYDVKKGKVKFDQSFSFYNGVATLDGTTKYTYKKGTLSNETYVSADGKLSDVKVYRTDGTLAKEFYTNSRYEGSITSVDLYDKYGNITSSATTSVYDGQTETYSTVYKHSYKNGKLVRTVSASTNRDGAIRPGSTTVYTYKKGKLIKYVKSVPWEFDENNGVTESQTIAVTYTYKNGLISGVNQSVAYSTASGSELYSTTTTVIRYKKIAVNKNCVKAVTERMSKFNDRYLPYQFR